MAKHGQVQEAKDVSVYYIGTHFKKTPVFTVKDRVYPDQALEERLEIGKPITVLDIDVKGLMEKSRVYLGRNKGFAESFTLDPNVAAAIKSKYEKGEAVSFSSQVTVEQALALVTTEEVKEQLLKDMSVEELEAALAARSVKASKSTNKPTTEDASVRGRKAQEEERGV